MKWAQNQRRLLKLAMNRFKRQIDELNQAVLMDETLEELIITKVHLNIKVDKGEHYWEQRARANWLRNSDKNASFFHMLVSQRRKVKQIDQLEDVEGNIRTDEAIMAQVACRYFEVLFTSRSSESSTRLLIGMEPLLRPE